MKVTGQLGSYDVVVCGGGTAGAAAAIAAGRTGAKTLVIEECGALGGTQTQGWVTPMMPNYVGPHKLSRGVNLEVISAQTEIQPAGDLDHGDDWYDPAALSLILDCLTSDQGVDCLFNATLVGAETESGRVSDVFVAACGSLWQISGNTFIDATGDADLCAQVGAELMSGNEEGAHQPLTLRFTMGNIKMDDARVSLEPFLRVNSGDYLELGYGEAMNSPMAPLVAEAVKRGTLAADDLGYFQIFTINGRPGELAFNTPRISGLDPLDPLQLSRAYQVGRKKIFRIAKFMRESFRGFENAYVSVVAPMMGIRESRRAVGEYVLTEEDHRECRKFSDVVARNRYPIDIHLKTGIDYRKFPPGEWHDIPYRSLVVKGFENLWVAGRCASATFVAQSAIRIQPVCRAMGEAAGVAAALCAKSGLSALELPYSDLRDRLDLAVPA